MAKDTLSITDNRTGKGYEIPIENDTIRAADLKQIKVKDDDFGMMSYDPAFGNTAACISKVTFIDGDNGILQYRGYPIEDLAEKSNFLEVSYLLLHGELPTKAEYDQWVHNIIHHTIVHENIKRFMDGFRYDAHPMGMLLGTVGALSTFYPEAKDIFNKEIRDIQVHRLIAKMPTMAAFAYRHSLGMPYVYPDNDLSYAGNFLNMLFKMTELKYKPNPAIERAIDILFILHADHEQNCSASAMRNVGSSLPDPYSATAAAIAALYGPLHGGANEGVLQMLKEIGSVNKHPRIHKEGQSGRVQAHGLRTPGIQVLRPEGQDNKGNRLRRIRGHGQEPAPRHSARARKNRARGRVLRQAQALPERGLLLGPHLPEHGQYRWTCSRCSSL